MLKNTVQLSGKKESKTEPSKLGANKMTFLFTATLCLSEIAYANCELRDVAELVAVTEIELKALQLPQSAHAAAELPDFAEFAALREAELEVPGRNSSAKSTPTGGWYQNEQCMPSIAYIFC